MLNVAYIALSLLHIRVHCLREMIKKFTILVGNFSTTQARVGQLIIASIRILGEGNVFSRVCLFTGGGKGPHVIATHPHGPVQTCSLENPLLIGKRAVGLWLKDL